jgi:hypothetical protein
MVTDQEWQNRNGDRTWNDRLLAESFYLAWSRKILVSSVYSAEVWPSTPRCTSSLAWSRKNLLFSAYAALVPRSHKFPVLP